MTRHRPNTRLAIAGWVAIMLIAQLVADPIGAQTMTNSFGGLSDNSDQPIDIRSDILTVYDAQQLAVFSGNVRAVQGTTTLRAGQLNVHYLGSANKLTGRGGDEPAPATPAVPVQPVAAEGKPGPDTGSKNRRSQISKIEARGNVVITSENDQTTTSDWALFDASAQTVTVGGNVVLSQDQNVLKGDRLVIDLVTGESRFANTGTAAPGSGDGRIRALFLPDGAAEQLDKKARKRSKRRNSQGELQEDESAGDGQPVRRLR